MKKKPVKEQRVNGSYCKFKSMQLRCTLMGCKSSYQFKNPSKQLFVKSFSTSNNLSNINPWFWTGLIDGEGSFTIIVCKSNTHNSGWRIEPKFQLGLHIRDLSLLKKFQQALEYIGKIYIYPKYNKINYIIHTKNDLTKLLFFLNKYPLLTQKAADFKLFEQAMELYVNKNHLSIEGLNQIINIKASINKGLSDFLKSEFKEYKSIQKPIIQTDKIPNPNWLAGFTTAEGNF